LVLALTLRPFTEQMTGVSERVTTLERLAEFTKVKVEAVVIEAAATEMTFELSTTSTDTGGLGTATSTTSVVSAVLAEPLGATKA
jgi:hypothetical protein